MVKIEQRMAALSVEVERDGKGSYRLKVTDDAKGNILSTMFKGINVGLDGKIILKNASDFAGETIIRDDKVQESLLQYFREHDPESITE